MKARIRFISFLTVLFCMLSLFSANPVFAYGKCSDWARSQLDTIDSAGLIPDVLENEDMTVNISRAELCKMAVLAYKKITLRDSLKAEKTDYFKDTSDPDIALAYELGIVSGYSNGNFGPNDKLTRQELFVFIANLFRSVGWSEDEYKDLFDSFFDSRQVGSWAKDATKIMLELGIVSGTGGNYITPGGTASIEQALCLLERAYDYSRYYIVDGKLYLLNNYFPDFPGRTYNPNSLIDPQELTLPQNIPAEHAYSACSDWAKSSLGYMEAWNLVPDSLNGLDFFKKNITREQFCEAAVLCYQKLTGDTTPAVFNHFSDTKNPSVNRAYELQIVSGYPDGTFRPGNSITRQEMFTMILNYMKSVGWEEYDSTYELFAQFSDSASISGWAKSAAKIAIELNIVKGTGSGKLLPLANSSREQAVIMFYRGFGYIDLWYSQHPLNPDTYPGHIVADNPDAQRAVDLAHSKLGCRYVYGTQGPNTFDCSGLVYWIYHTQLGYSMGRTATAQWKNGIQISVDWTDPGKTMKPGDLVYFRSSPGSSSIGHIGIYVGEYYNGEKTPYGKYSFIHAANSSVGVVWGNLNSDYYRNNRIYGVRRIAC